MSHHPASTAPTSVGPGRAPASVRAATVLLVVLAVALGLVTLLLLVGGVAGALTRTDVGPVDPARQLGRLVGGAVGLLVPLTLTGLVVWTAVALRARRSWPSRVLTVLAAADALVLVGAVALVLWWSLRSGVDVSGILVAILVLVPTVAVLALPVTAAVLLRRPTARAWCDDLRSDGARGPRRPGSARHVDA